MVPALAFTVLLGGCNVGPDYRKPPILTGAVPAPVLTSTQEAAFDTVSPLPPRWWKLFDDPLLDALEEKALVRNTDLRTALASLEQAQAMLHEVYAERLPSTTVLVDPSYGQPSADALGLKKAPPAAALYDMKQIISYDLDLFGRLRRTTEAAKADVESAQASLDLARVNIASSTAQAYAQVCGSGLQIATTNASIGTAQKVLYVTQRQFEAGISGSNDVVRARQLLRQTKSMLPDQIAQQRNALFMLATLTGDVPEAFPAAIASCASPPLIRQSVPVGDGAALLARRPDVRQAERKLASAIAQIGVSTAALFPSITIGATVGTTTPKFNHILSEKAFSWNINSLATVSIPNFLVARAMIESSNASARGALANFDGTLLTALREAESASTTLARQIDKVQDLTASRDDAAKSSANTQQMYRAGVGIFYEVLDAERTLISAESSLASAKTQVSQDQIMLFMALGGGWENTPAIVGTTLQSVTK